MSVVPRPNLAKHKNRIRFTLVWTLPPKFRRTIGLEKLQKTEEIGADEAPATPILPQVDNSAPAPPVG